MTTSTEITVQNQRDTHPRTKHTKKEQKTTKIQNMHQILRQTMKIPQNEYNSTLKFNIIQYKE